MKRKLLAIMMAVCVTASFAGGSATVFAAQEESTAKDEVIVTMPTTSEPESGFDPAYGWGAGEHVHEPLIQSTLTTTNTDLSIGMDLATDYSVSDDGLTWTVKIRDDVKFTDGEALTASDVAFTYNNCRDNSSVNDFSMLKEAVAVDDTTVEFHMNTPFAVWPYTMAIVGIVPEHAYNENYGQDPIGSGRYIMKQWDKGQQVIFEANPDYYGEAPKMKKVTVLFMEEDAALAAAQSGTVDVAHTAASYSDMTVDGYDLFSVQTVDNRGFNLPATAAEEIDGVTYGNDFTSDIDKAILSHDRRYICSLLTADLVHQPAARFEIAARLFGDPAVKIKAILAPVQSQYRIMKPYFIHQLLNIRRRYIRRI